MYLKKNILLFIFILFAFYSLIGTFHSAISFNWSFQDWLINYEGGFVRRGLAGEFISFVSNNFFDPKGHLYFGVQIHSIYFFFISFFYLLYYSLLYFFLKNEKINFQNLFIIFSPLSLPFIIYNIGAIARKEILFFIILLSFVFLINFLKKKELSIIFLIFLFPLALLIHEGIFFFISIFVILYLFEINTENKKFILFYSLLFILIALITFILIIFFKGNSIQVNQICSSLSAYPIKNCTGLSAIGMLSDSHTIKNEFNGLWTRAFKDKYLFYYPLFGLIGFFPFIKCSNNYCFNLSISNKVYNLNFFIISVILFINTLPLYLFTHDWGRWLNITYILLMITFFYLRKTKKIYMKRTENLQSTLINQSSSKKIILTIILLFYSTILSVSYFGGYTYWLHNYTKIDNYLRFCLNFLKTLPHLFY